MKVIQPLAGLFYLNNLVVTKVSTNTVLVKGTDYTLIGLSSDVVARTGFEAASGIAFTNQNATGLYSINYSAVGGIEGGLNAMFKQLADKLENLDSSSADYFDIKNRPLTYPFEDHLHELIDDLTGLNPLELALEKIVYSLQNRRVPTLAAANLKDAITKIHYMLGELQRGISNIVPPSIPGDYSTLITSVNSLITDVNEINTFLTTTDIDNRLNTIETTIDGLTSNTATALPTNILNNVNFTLDSCSPTAWEFNRVLSLDGNSSFLVMSQVYQNRFVFSKVTLHYEVYADSLGYTIDIDLAVQGDAVYTGSVVMDTLKKSVVINITNPVGLFTYWTIVSTISSAPVAYWYLSAVVIE
jgi:hypothetical protein